MSEQKPRVLVVDDEPSIAKIVRKQLEVAGYEATVAITGTEGLAKTKELHPDLVILDVMLPGMNGFEVCAAIKQDETLKSIPIIMLTAKAQRQDAQTGLQQGADAYLTKPFDLNELLGQAKKLIQKPASPQQPAPPQSTPPQQPQGTGS